MATKHITDRKTKQRDKERKEVDDMLAMIRRANQLHWLLRSIPKQPVAYTKGKSFAKLP